MDSSLPEKIESMVREFLSELVSWACERDDLLAIALVGSQARGEAKPDSDIDILLLLDNPDDYLQRKEWISLFGDVDVTTIEDWGKVTSLRVQYSNGLEVEFGLTDGSWGADPKDAGDKRVIDDGIIVLCEKRCHLSSRLSRFAPGSGSNSIQAGG